MMNRVGNILKCVLIFSFSFYVLICSLLFFFQEKLIFVPKKLADNFVFSFDQPFEEINFKLSDGNHLNGLLFKADSSRGLIFYLHGNAGALDTWGDAAQTYLDLNYDFFIIDYRGYGKSSGIIKSEEVFHEDIRTAYNKILEKYREDQIVIAGYSIGTGPATILASQTNPKLLVLQAPYFNLTTLALSQYPFIPGFLVRYKFETSALIQAVKAPVYIFHGDEDDLINVNHAYELQKLFKPSDKLVVLKGLGHNGMNRNEQYKMELAKLLSD